MGWRFIALAGVVVASLTGGCNRTIAGGNADGARVFAEACARCHGEAGVPDRGMVAQIGVKDLTSDRVKALSDDELRSQIVHGSKNMKMPSFAGALTDEQVEAAIAHVRSLSR